MKGISEEQLIDAMKRALIRKADAFAEKAEAATTSAVDKGGHTVRVTTPESAVANRTADSLRAAARNL
jgi:hypothetical protein